MNRAKLPALPAETDAEFDAAVQEQEDAIRDAIGILWAMSGRQFGVCETKVRPCKAGTNHSTGFRRWSTPAGFSGFSYLVWDGSGWGTNTCGCGSLCTLAGPAAAHLPGPVFPEDSDHVVTVTVDGEVLDESKWVLEGDVLYRRGAAWPSQNLNRPDGDVGTWSVTYWRGQKVPTSVGTHVGTLAAELLLSAAGENCRLPASVRRVSRQGVAMEIDPLALIQAGCTGLVEVDRWLISTNPNRLQQPPQVI